MTLEALAPAVRRLGEAMREAGVARLRVGDIELSMHEEHEAYPEFQPDEPPPDVCSHPPELRMGNVCRKCGVFVGPLRAEEVRREN